MIQRTIDIEHAEQRVINYTQRELVPVGATPVGYQLPASATYEEWRLDGRRLNLLDKWKNFAIGDWLLQGSDRYGEVCYQEVDEFGWGSHDKMKKLVWVARNVPPHNRDMRLTWTHHHHVASIPQDEQTKWLLLAIERELTAEELKEAVGVARGPQLPKLSLSFAEPTEAPFNHHPRVGIPENERTAVDEYEQQADEYAETEQGYTWSDDEEEPVIYPQATEQFYTNGTGKPHVANNSGNNEWYTPVDYIEAARLTLGTIDLDPASSDEANTVVRATRHCTIDDDGLAQNWSGRVWMNPPYSSDLVGRFIDKIIYHYCAGDVPEAIVLVNNATETQWFQTLAAHVSAICFPAKRIRFWTPTGESGSPLQGQAILYLGPNADNFIDNFSFFGLLARVAVVHEIEMEANQ